MKRSDPIDGVSMGRLLWGARVQYRDGPDRARSEQERDHQALDFGGLLRSPGQRRTRPRVRLRLLAEGPIQGLSGLTRPILLLSLRNLSYPFQNLACSLRRFHRSSVHVHLQAAELSVAEAHDDVSLLQRAFFLRPRSAGIQ